jgi:hypothetical protein
VQEHGEGEKGKKKEDKRQANEANLEYTNVCRKRFAQIASLGSGGPLWAAKGAASGTGRPPKRTGQSKDIKWKGKVIYSIITLRLNGIIIISDLSR